MKPTPPEPMTLSSCTTPLLILLLSSTPTIAQESWGVVDRLTDPRMPSFSTFGDTVAVNREGQAVIGAAVDGGDNVGAAWVYDLDRSEWLYELSFDDVGPGDLFGFAVDISSQHVIASAIGFDGAEVDDGIAIVYDRETGAEVRRYVPRAGPGMKQFGYDVELEGDRAIIGSRFEDGGRGAAYFFEIERGFLLYRLTPDTGGSNEALGSSVATEPWFAIVGAPGAYNGEGIAYWWDFRFGTLFTFEFGDELREPGAAVGTSVAMSDELAVIGAPGANGGLGAVGLYALPEGLSTELIWLGNIEPDDFPVSQPRFGTSLDIDGNRLAIGAPDLDRSPEGAGQAFLYDATTFSVLTELTPGNLEIGSNFGRSLSIGDPWVLAGAPTTGAGLGIDASAFSFTRNRLLRIAPEPLLAREPGVFEFYNLVPQERAWLLYSTVGTENGTSLPRLGVTVDLDEPGLIFGPATADQDGRLTLNSRIGDVPRTLDIWFQAVQPEVVTNAVATRIVR